MTKYNNEELKALFPNESNPEYWRKIFRERQDPIMAFSIYPRRPCLKVLRRVAKEEGAVNMYRARRGWFKGKYIVEFKGFPHYHYFKYLGREYYFKNDLSKSEILDLGSFMKEKFNLVWDEQADRWL